ncbi:hypothetical protein EV174_003389 [Coemansia sp. RSA 2320]|nr:hypothetical protein EV174_003389 [Coemansia sp. RSA 2320]
MDDAALSATAATSISPPSVAMLDDFGLIDYESPGADHQHQEQPHSAEEEGGNEDSFAGALRDEPTAADGLIDFEESDTELPAEHAMDHDNYQADSPAAVAVSATAEQLGQSLQESHLSPASDHELQPDPMLEDEEDIEVEADPMAEGGTTIEQHSHQPPHTDVPETWVHCDGDWMIYLGPNQLSYEASYQHSLFAMPLDQLISALHSDISLREDMELALEFPSLALTIDQRDPECAEVSLAQIFNCHAAAVRLGRLSEDLVASPYFAHSIEPTSLSASPLPDSFAFIIHTRFSVHSSLKRIMQIADDAQNAPPPAVGSTAHDEPQQVNGTAVESDSAVAAAVNGGNVSGSRVDHPSNDAAAADENLVEVSSHEDAVVESGTVELPAATTADLLADADEDEDDDEDYVAEGEEEGDHVLEVQDDEEEEEGEDGDFVDEEEEDDIVDVEDGAETRVESLSASPKHKRAQDCIAEQRGGDEVVPDCDAPAAKRPRSESEGEELVAAQL